MDIARAAAAAAVIATITVPASLGSQPAQTTARHAQASARLVIRNVMVVYGSGKPAYGPMDVTVENGLIAEVRAARAEPPADATVIDGTGRYLLPGFVNTHMHWHEERMPGVPQPIQYERNLYLAAGVTTARELGGNFDKSIRWRAESAAHQIVAPRLVV